MKLDELYEMWAEDCEIDPTELDKESIKIAKLHNRYLRIYSDEKIILLRLQADMKVLKKEKHIFYIDGPTKETLAKGWILPSKGTIYKPEISTYLEADQDIIELSLRIGYQSQKVEFLESAIKSLNNRGYNIRAAIDFRKFNAGEGR
jgi:hypothetical protein